MDRVEVIAFYSTINLGSVFWINHHSVQTCSHVGVIDSLFIIRSLYK